MPFSTPEGGERMGGLRMRFLKGDDLDNDDKGLLRQRGLKWETRRRYESRRGLKVVPRLDVPKADLTEERPELGEGLEK